MRLDIRSKNNRTNSISCSQFLSYIDKAQIMENLRTKLKPVYVTAIIFQLLIGFILLSVRHNCYALGSLRKIAKEAVETGAKSGAKGGAKVLKHLGAFAVHFSEISARNSEDIILAITKNSNRLELQMWGNGAIKKRFILNDPTEITNLLKKYNNFNFHMPEEDVIQYQNELVSATKNKQINVELVTEVGDSLPIAIKMINNSPSLAIKYSDNLLFSLRAWKKRSMLQSNVMADLIERLKIVVLRKSPKERQEFNESFGKNVSFIESESDLNKELSELKKQFVIIVGHVEQDRFLLKDDGKTLINKSIKDINNSLDSRESVSLLMGCKIAQNTEFTGPYFPVFTNTVIEGIKQGIKGDTPIQFLDKLSKEIGQLYIDEDILGRLYAVSDKNVNKNVILSASTSTGVYYSYQINFPKKMPVFIRPLYLVFWVYSICLFLGWIAIDKISDFDGVTFIWKKYVLVAKNSNYNALIVKNKFYKFCICLFGPHLMVLSLCIALILFPFMFIIKRASWIPFINSLQNNFFRLRWLPFYIVYLCTLPAKLIFRKIGD